MPIEWTFVSSLSGHTAHYLMHRNEELHVQRETVTPIINGEFHKLSFEYKGLMYRFEHMRMYGGWMPVPMNRNGDERKSRVPSAVWDMYNRWHAEHPHAGEFGTPEVYYFIDNSDVEYRTEKALLKALATEASKKEDTTQEENSHGS